MNLFVYLSNLQQIIWALPEMKSHELFLAPFLGAQIGSSGFDHSKISNKYNENVDLGLFCPELG